MTGSQLSFGPGQGRTTPAEDLTPEEESILDVIGPSAAHVGELAREIGIPVARLYSALALLELKGIVTQVEPMRFATSFIKGT
ncbi:MAG TPA: hypothetical protein QGF35_04890 [Dehalococcoidia bacterium]|nr:hypothetical protein [Dehalococcoidia bacterium]